MLFIPKSDDKIRPVFGSSRGFVSQSVQMDPLERMRRWKRSLDGFISVRKAVLIAFCFLVFLLYAGPSIFEWLFGDGSSLFH